MKSKIIYLSESILNILVSITALVYGIIFIANKSEPMGISVPLIVVAVLFLGLSIFYLINIFKDKVSTKLWINLFALAMCVISLFNFVLVLCNFHIIFFIIFLIEFILTFVAQFFISPKEIAQRYKHVQRTRKRSPTCTIQISTEYLVKESYTEEEALKTIEQLYNLRENDGFSTVEFERIKAKIIKNTKKND